MLRKNYIKLALSALLLVPISASAATLTYSLNHDWSDTQNPNFAWSYNYNDSPIGVFQTFWWGQPGWSVFNFAEACIMKGSPPAPGAPDPFGGFAPAANDWKPNDVVMAAMSIPYGGGSTYVNVRWTSPADGTISITGRAWDAMIAGYQDRDVGWALLVGGQTVAQRYSVTGLHRGDAAALFGGNLLENASLKNIPVTQGEVVEFRVISNSYYGAFVGVQETIVLKTKGAGIDPFLAIFGLVRH
jgi:hypothetical protein